MFFKRKKIEPTIEIKGQSWHIKKRHKDGKLMAVTTLDHLPSETELSEYGPGNYYIYTTKPHFKCVSKILITNYQRKDIKKKRPEKSKSKKYRERPLKRVKVKNRVNENSEETSCEVAITHEPPASPVETIDRTPEPPIKDYTRIDLQLCEFCNKQIQYTAESVKCHYCGQLLHSWCYSKHDCAESFLCPGCGERGSYDEAEQMPYCRRYFHSPLCVDKCYDNNRYNQECRDRCNGSIDLIDEQEPQGEEEFLCSYCEAPLENQKYVYECKYCDEVFCCNRCGKNYHQERAEQYHLHKVKFENIEWE